VNKAYLEELSNIFIQIKKFDNIEDFRIFSKTVSRN